MKKNLIIIVSTYLFLAVTVQIAKAQQPAYQDDELTSDMFSVILKDEWTYLRDATDQLNKETGNRGEFETTPEFHARAGKARQTFLNRLDGHIKEAKLERRVFGVWFKAALVSYDADAGIYSVKCKTRVDAPYEVPTVNCVVPDNPYVEIADTIQGGYRTSQIFTKFDPDFKWVVARNDAMNAKNNESNMFFKIHFVLNMTLDSSKNRGLLKIIPKDISVMNQTNKFIYWKEEVTTSEK